MDVTEFKSKFNTIVNSIPNTNYGSILGQIHLMLLVQELYLSGKYSQDEIVDLYYELENEMSDDWDVEAKVEAVSEVAHSLVGSHRTGCLFDDYGEAFISNNFTILNRFITNKSLFNKCNEWNL